MTDQSVTRLSILRTLRRFVYAMPSLELSVCRLPPDSGLFHHATPRFPFRVYASGDGDLGNGHVARL
jgi:hypothetical protein